MSLDERSCAVCRKPLSARQRKHIEETGEGTCEICGLVLAICPACERYREDETSAAEDRFVKHLKACEALGAHEREALQ